MHNAHMGQDAPSAGDVLIDVRNVASAAGGSLEFGIECSCGGRVEAAVVLRSGNGIRNSATSGRLSGRQFAVLDLVSWGRSDREIATLLNLTLNQVKREIRGILVALSATNRAHAAAFAIRGGLLV